ncbi:MAG: phosphatase PAP2 family protein [Candidatus Ochrobactrum gambitense]|nr:MAG: phosphatase PAP2 family protein [Candidatus Ochrobactrum gambitense]WEK15556.1 MAG: phosphatase PAP2 family protein [Candidatus Ochrobactrum gambitense]
MHNIFLFTSINRVFQKSSYVYLFIAINALFIVSPQIDLAFSRHFYQSGAFFAADSVGWIILRDFHRASQLYLLVILLILLTVYALWRHPLPSIAPHKVVYVFLTFILGPGALVHSLKLLIGRARPRHLLEFGGAMDFTPAWQMAATCSKNCSFPSGEGAAAAAMLSLLIFVPERWRVVSAAIFIPILVLVSMNRVFMGAHFLSDVVIAWSLVVGVMLWLWPRINAKAETIDSWVRCKGQSLRTRA